MMLGVAKPSRPLLAVSAGILTYVIALSPASATDGYFQYGYGARQKALGGAGVADSRDATAAALNPAGLVHAPTELTLSGTLFSPSREYSVSGAGPASGRFRQQRRLFSGAQSRLHLPQSWFAVRRRHRRHGLRQRRHEHRLSGESFQRLRLVGQAGRRPRAGVPVGRLCQDAGARPLGRRRADPGASGYQDRRIAGLSLLLFRRRPCH